MRYGLIGTGMMGQEHIRNLNLIEGAEITALADPDTPMLQDALKQQGGTAQIFNDYREMLSADLCDAYLIASPNDLHHGNLLETMPSNKPILCEKPMCTTLEDCREVVDLQQNRSAPIWVAMEYRYMPPVQAMLKELDGGTAGTPVMMSIREHRFPFLDKVADWNRFSRRTGGTLVEKCCHFWDLMRHTLKSDPVRVYASAAMDINHQTERYDGKMPDIIDNAFVIVDFASGARGMLDLCMFAEGSYWQEIISVTGPKSRIDACVPGPARFSADGKERHAQLVISDRATKVPETRDIHVDEKVLNAGDHHGSTYFQHLKFYDLIKNGKSVPEVDVHDGLWSVAIGLAAEQSAKTGQPVDLTRYISASSSDLDIMPENDLRAGIGNG